MIANRVSYHLDLVGPSVPVDTACSSSVTATHLAVQSIRSGDCDAAVVAGIQLNHRFVDWVQYSQGGILAPDGKCKPFDVSANGYDRFKLSINWETTILIRRCLPYVGSRGVRQESLLF